MPYSYSRLGVPPASLCIAAVVERDEPDQQFVRLIVPRLRSTSVRMALRSCCPNRTDGWCLRVIHEGTRYLNSCSVFLRLEIMWRTICFALMLYMSRNKPLYWNMLFPDTLWHVLEWLVCWFCFSVLLKHTALWKHLFTSGQISSLACRKISVLRFLLTPAV